MKIIFQFWKEVALFFCYCPKIAHLPSHFGPIVLCQSPLLWLHKKDSNYKILGIGNMILTSWHNVEKNILYRLPTHHLKTWSSWRLYRGDESLHFREEINWKLDVSNSKFTTSKRRCIAMVILNSAGQRPVMWNVWNITSRYSLRARNDLLHERF